MSITCFINGRLHSRTHCTIAGYSMPVLGIIGILRILDIFDLSLLYIPGTFWLLLLAGYIPEWFGVKYIRKVNGVI